jgi:hypothetical protein
MTAWVLLCCQDEFEWLDRPSPRRGCSSWCEPVRHRPEPTDAHLRIGENQASCCPVVQVESHPYLPETERLEFYNENDIAFLAFAPLGHGIRPGLLEDPVISAIATPVEKTPAQVLLSWAGQRARLCLPRPRLRFARGRISTSPFLQKTRLTKSITFELDRGSRNRTGIPGFISRGRST